MYIIYVNVFFLLSFFLSEIKTIVSQKAKSKSAATKKNVVRGSRVSVSTKKNVPIRTESNKAVAVVAKNVLVDNNTNVNANNASSSNNKAINNKITLERIIQPDALNGLNAIARSVNMSVEEFFTQYITLYAIIVAMQITHTHDMQEFSQKLMGIKADEKKLAEVLSKNMEKIVVASSQYDSGNLISLLSANMRKLALYIVVSIGDSSRENNVCRDTFNMICDRYKVLFEVEGRVSKDFKSIIHREMQVLAKSNKASFLAINVNHDLSHNSLAGSLLPQLLNFVACPPTNNMTKEANAYADLSYTLLAMILSFNGVDINQIQFEKLSERSYAYIAKWVGGVIAVGVISALVAGAVLENSDYVKNASDKDGFWKKRALGLVKLKETLVNPVTGAVKGAYKFITDHKGYKADKEKQRKQDEEQSQQDKVDKEKNSTQEQLEGEKQQRQLEKGKPQKLEQDENQKVTGQDTLPEPKPTEASKEIIKPKLVGGGEMQAGQKQEKVILSGEVSDEKKEKSVEQMLNDIGGLNEEEYEYNPVKNFGKKAIDYIGSGVSSIFNNAAQVHLKAEETGLGAKTKAQQQEWEDAKQKDDMKKKDMALKVQMQPVSLPQSTVEEVKNDGSQQKS